MLCGDNFLGDVAGNEVVTLKPGDKGGVLN